MRILVSNDDGYRAPGVKVLADALRPLGSVCVVAPESNRSGASNSLTLDRPLRLGEASTDFYWVDGTPTDCVHVAVTEILGGPPDWVVSGINDGENLGDDVLYSGTVAAAMEGCFLGAPAIAVSLAWTDGEDHRHFDTAAEVTRQLLLSLSQQGAPSRCLLNVNVPNVPIDSVQGIRNARLGERHKAAAVVRQSDPKGRPVFWIGPSGAPQVDGPGTDFHCVQTGYVAVTPLQFDLTDHGRLAEFSYLEQALK